MAACHRRVTSGREELDIDRLVTTHVGSIIRPAALLADLEAIRRGEQYDEDRFAQELDAAVEAVVKRQADIGIDILNDGEMGKIGWINYVYNRVSGIESRTVVLAEKDVIGVIPDTVDREAVRGSEGFYTNFWTERFEVGADATIWTTTGPISYDSNFTAVDTDIANLDRARQGIVSTDAFITAVAPGSLHWITNDFYSSEEEFIFAFAEALGAEYRRIVDAGYMLQVDDAVLWHKYGTIRLTGGSPDDYGRWATLRVEALNHALAGIPPERVRYHICTGSGHGPHTIDPNLTDVLPYVLAVNAQCILLEQGNARHEHEWRVWEDVELPDDKVLAPGVVTHHTEMVEHPELVAQRLVRLAKIVGRERVIASTDCGFAQMAPRRRVPEWTQWAKLQALVDGARIASGQLWRTANAA